MSIFNPFADKGLLKFFVPTRVNLMFESAACAAEFTSFTLFSEIPTYLTQFRWEFVSRGSRKPTASNG